MKKSIEKKLKILTTKWKTKLKKTTNYMITTMMFWKREAILTKISVLAGGSKEGKGEWMDSKWERGWRAGCIKKTDTAFGTQQAWSRTNQAQDGGRFYSQSAWSLMRYILYAPTGAMAVQALTVTGQNVGSGWFPEKPQSLSKIDRIFFPLFPTENKLPHCEGHSQLSETFTLCLWNMCLNKLAFTSLWLEFFPEQSQGLSLVCPFQRLAPRLVTCPSSCAPFSYLAKRMFRAVKLLCMIL